MRFATTARFDADYRRLKPAERETFRSTVRAFHDACEAWQSSKGRSGWPASLRVRPLRSAPGVWEMTWSFTGPDGRATWEWVVTPDGPSVRWRRIGSHAIFDLP